MILYEEIRQHCKKSSALAEEVIDRFLLHYAVEKYGVDKSMNLAFSRFKHLFESIGMNNIRMFYSQFIVHQIFGPRQLIHKMLTHGRIKTMGEEERAFLSGHAEQLWRFSFGYIRNNPEKDFFEMKDFFTEEEYLLYSPGISDMLKGRKRTMWFNLISFNGQCWQSFGPIIGFAGLDPIDVFFFATELEPDLETRQEVVSLMERNPVPFMMLTVAMEHPETWHEQDKLMHVVSEFDLDDLDVKLFGKTFIVETTQEVVKLSLKRWESFPHFAAAYFDPTEKIILLTAMTDRGFRALVQAFEKVGLLFEEEPFVRVSITGLLTTRNVLKQPVVLNEYEELFSGPDEGEQNDETDCLNAFLRMVIPDINAGRTPQINELAAAAGVDPEVARQLVKDIQDRLK